MKMLNQDQITRLKKSWGEKASTLNCNAEIRVYDPLSCWECYIYSMNPQNEDEIECILHGFTTQTCEWTLTELFSRFNAEGQQVKIDSEFRPKNAKIIYDKLKEQEYYEFYRN